MAEDYRDVAERAFVNHLATTTRMSREEAAARLASSDVRDALHAACRAAVQNAVASILAGDLR